MARRSGAAAVTATAAAGMAFLASRLVSRPRGELSRFRSPEAERRYLRAYEQVLAQWPVACEELTVPTPFGDTHVVTSGDTHTPPLVLLHATVTSSTGWLSNIGPLSDRHRVFAVDRGGDVVGDLVGEVVGGSVVGSAVFVGSAVASDWGSAGV